MTAARKSDHAILDRPEILRHLFHPRAEGGRSAPPPNARDILIPVEDNVAIGARFHLSDKIAPNILFFHGNGEIVSDYNELGPLYGQLGINFLAVDYRGYGRSTGEPTVTAMMQDCHTIFDFTQDWLKENGYTGCLVPMGRSLGSASVLELASNYPSRIDGLIIESGFAFASPLLTLLGIDPERIHFREESGFQNLEKIQNFIKPTLIIHAERDHIIPFSDGQALYDTCLSSRKSLLKIPGANHNDIFLQGISEYLKAVKWLMDQASLWQLKHSP